MAETLHGTAVVFCGRGILLRGESGSGKSDLALRLIEAGGALVGDDRVAAVAENNILYAEPPPRIAGLIEIRGVGLKRLPYLSRARLDVCIDCVPAESVPRLPDALQAEILGVKLPLFRLYPFEASGVAKIRALLQYPAAS